MKSKRRFVQIWFPVVLGFLSFATTSISSATTHTITFSFTFYSDSVLSVNVGDTIVWQGAFSSHPLVSTGVPNGVTPFSHNTGTSFMYVVNVEGLYTYKCNVHGNCCGMTGRFTASLTGVGENSRDQNSFQLEQNFPNPFNPRTSIHFSVPTSNFVTLKVFDIVGNEVATLVNEKKSPGNYVVEFDGANLASGIYLYRLQVGNFSDTKKLALIK